MLIPNLPDPNTNLAGESGPPAPVHDPGPSSPVTPMPPWAGVSTIPGQFSPAGVYDLPAVTPYGVWNYTTTLRASPRVPTRLAVHHARWICVSGNASKLCHASLGLLCPVGGARAKKETSQYKSIRVNTSQYSWGGNKTNSKNQSVGLGGHYAHPPQPHPHASPASRRAPAPP